MIDLEEYKRGVREEIERTRKSLEPLEKGEMRLASRKFGATEWVDNTDEWINRHKETIATYEEILRKLESGEKI